MKRQGAALIPTPWGKFNMIAYADQAEAPMPHLAMVHEDFDTTVPTLVRIHSECMTGDLFGSKRCDCGEQLEKSLEMTGQEKGIIIYLRQEGRGIGLINKLKAYELQDKGMNTIDANTHLGLEIDARTYEAAIKMLEDLGVKAVRLLTNNPLKAEAVEKSSLKLIERVPLLIKPGEGNKLYLKTKQELMGHFL
ncbi:MAG: GTP cyclohydrolase II [Phaeodactylibacter sp.]|nr:GTP cyclohydrolase II [Phaeodactylibacter sp.]